MTNSKGITADKSDEEELEAGADIVDKPLPRKASTRTLEVVSLGAPAPLSRSSSVHFDEQEKGNLQEERLRVSILSYHITRWFMGTVLSSPFPIFFALVSDSLTQLAPNIPAVFLTSFILLLTQQAFDSLGRLLAEVAGRKSIARAVCLGTIVSQMLVIAGGFYRTVNPVISAVSKEHINCCWNMRI